MTPSAYPEQKPPKSGMLGWRCVVQGKRGSSAKGTQQIMVHGTWFHLRDTDRIRSVSQREGGAEGEEREARRVRDAARMRDAFSRADDEPQVFHSLPAGPDDGPPVR